MRKVSVGELIMDFTIYPRSDVDAQTVAKLRECDDAGAELPPVIINKSTMQVVDGFHRVRMYRAKYGGDHKIDVVEKEYPNDGEMFADCIRHNLHGRPLSVHDHVHCLQVGERLGVPDDEIASALSITVERAGKLRAERVGQMRVGRTKEPVALKQTISHMAGKTMNKRQREANEKLSGMRQSFYANQIIELIDADLVDTSNESTMDALRKLHDRLSAFLESVPDVVMT